MALDGFSIIFLYYLTGYKVLYLEGLLTETDVTVHLIISKIPLPDRIKIYHNPNLVGYYHDSFTTYAKGILKGALAEKGIDLCEDMTFAYKGDFFLLSPLTVTDAESRIISKANITLYYDDTVRPDVLCKMEFDFEDLSFDLSILYNWIEKYK
jgi:hypothetical protein